MRLHSISLYDRKGDVLWLSEGALGPDENGFLLEADFGDGRGAIFLAVRSPQSELVGLVMILVDAKALTANLASRILTPSVRSLLQRVAILLRPPGTDASASPGPAPVAEPAAAPAPQPLTLAVAEAPKAAPAPPAPPARAAARAAPPRVERRTEPAAPSRTARAPAARASAPARPSVPAAAPAAVASAEPIAEPAPRKSTGSPSAEITLEVLVPRQVDEILSFELTEDLPSAADAMAAGERSAAASGRRPASEPRETSASPSRETSASPSRETSASPSRETSASPRESAASSPRETPASSPRAAPASSPKKPAVPASPPVYVQELTKLRTGGRTRRFRAELHVVESAASEGDGSPTQRHEPQAHALVLKQLIDWLRAHPERRDHDPLSIAIGLPLQALQNERLPALLTGTLEPAALEPDTLGFELPESACLTHKPAVERLLAACEKLGCFVALDDFSLDSGALEFLRSKAVRVVRVDSRLTGTAMRDKLAQARVIAISQATKVLGIHCVAKGVESETTRRWLTAIGFDFAEGRLFEGPKPLDSLLSGQ